MYLLKITSHVLTNEINVSAIKISKTLGKFVLFILSINLESSISILSVFKKRCME